MPFSRNAAMIVLLLNNGEGRGILLEEELRWKRIIE